MTIATSRGVSVRHRRTGGTVGRIRAWFVASVISTLLLTLGEAAADPPAVLGETTRVSVDSDGTQANGLSVQPAISADGRFVAFGSSASNLVEGDTPIAQGADPIAADVASAGPPEKIGLPAVPQDGLQGFTNIDLQPPAGGRGGTVPWAPGCTFLQLDSAYAPLEVTGIASPDGTDCYAFKPAAGTDVILEVAEGRNIIFSIADVADAVDEYRFRANGYGYTMTVGQLMRSVTDEPYRVILYSGEILPLPQVGAREAETRAMDPTGGDAAGSGPQDGALRSRARFDAAHDTAARIESTIAAHFPPLPPDASLLAKAGRVNLLNALQVMALEAIFEISVLANECETNGGAKVCPIGPDRAVMAQLLALGDACPAEIKPADRIMCLIELQGSLASHEALLYGEIRQQPILDNSNLWRVWDRHGRPPLSQAWLAIPELRAFSEMDAILLFTTYFKLRTLEQMNARFRRFDELTTLLVPEAPMLSAMMIMPNDMWLRTTLTDLERLWSLAAYDLVMAGNWGIDDWLKEMRGEPDRISSDRVVPPGPLPRVSVQDGEPPDTEVPPADADPGQPAARPSTQSTESGAAKRPIIWNKDGSPVFLPGDPSAGGSGSAKPSGQTGSAKPSGQTEGFLSLPRPSGAPPGGWAYDWKMSQSFLEEAAWHTMERSARGKNLAELRKSRAIWNVVGTVVDVIGIGHEILERDQVGAYVATLETLGGPYGAFVIQVAGIDEKLRSLDAAGYKIPEVMGYCAENASLILNPFVRASRVPYSQMHASTGPYERSTPSAEWLKQKRAAIEDAERRR